MSDTMDLTIDRADYQDRQDAEAIVDLLDAYARDPMGGAEALPPTTREKLVDGLAATPGAFSLIARLNDEPVGLANCFIGYSTFAAAPLVNIHDVVVLPETRGRGIGLALMGAVEKEARLLGACKVTLEVLSGNSRAMAVYEKCGFSDYQLDPEAGRALFWQKKIL